MSFHKIKKIFLSFFSVLILFFVVSFIPSNKKKPSKTSVIIEFENFVGNEILKLDTGNYKNELEQEYTVSRFKYYIGNIRLKKKNGKDFSSDNYFLVNEEEPSSKKIILNDVPSGVYESIDFIIGVDSLHNCSGVQSGALDPLNGMFWAWNTGYIFMKFEGKSSASKSTGNFLEFHIGGYRNPNNCIRNITLNLSNNNLILSAENAGIIRIKTDVSEIFKSPKRIDFTEYSAITDFHNAVMLTDNYKDMFSIISVK